MTEGVKKSDFNSYRTLLTTLAITFSLTSCYFGKKAYNEEKNSMNMVYSAYALAGALSCFATRSRIKYLEQNPPKINPPRLTDTFDGEIKVNPKLIKVICKD